jgi:hypothetical protein
MMRENPEISKVAKGCLAYVGESSLMKDLFDGVWRAMCHQVINVLLRDRCIICNIPIYNQGK